MRVRELTRRGEIVRLMRKLEWDGFPRLQMLLIVMLTGLAGLIASYALLRAGLDAMSARYPLAVGIAYLAFLFLLWLWLRTNAEDYADAPPDILPGGGQGSSSGASESVAGGGGQFGGGGASGHFQMDDALPSPSLPLNVPGGDTVGKTAGEALGGADEGAIPLAIALLLAAVAAALLFASLYVVYMAPALFAELLLDGVLSASLYRRMRGLQTRHWLESAVRRTVLPFAITAMTLGVAGHFLHAYAPGSHTLGEVLQHYRQS